ncbi:serine/threonine-protein kinase [Polyangium spumosum]|uniref:Protein kinase n=1 Tax=Polyangium spumosum TaxID=889282 RepID=A0A6N7Q6W3_9BACT|nr:serine/threonine-protein kinase [Polyangium spumosum]MRG98034.1 protein kinase [Polyangium spumosum]
MSHVPVRPGDVLARKYRVERVLGAGAMGVVVAARHVELGQLVAVKALLTGRAVIPEQHERFLREARAAVRLKSHHVARVLDVGADEKDAPYIVMEYLEGQDLAAVLKARRILPFEEAVAYVLQACEAVGEAHAAGIVHRDLKPANLFLTHDVSGAPCVKVLDFGISKVASADVALTHESQMLGSPLYMSPEQMTAPKSVDARSDVWALGVILYQLVAGRTPFHAETVHAVSALVVAREPTPLGHHRPDAPPGFEAVIRRCLVKDREGRFRDVAELAAALAPYAPAEARPYVERVARVVGARGSRGSSSAGMVAAAATAAPSMPVGASPSAPVVASAARKAPVPLGVLIASGVAAAVVAGLLVVFVLMKREPVAASAAVVETEAAAVVVADAGAGADAGADADAGAGADVGAALPVVPTVSPVPEVAPAKVVPVVKPPAPGKAPAKPAKRTEDLYAP